MNKILAGLGGLGAVAYIGYGIICMLAVIDGIQVWFGVNIFFAVIISFFVAYMPLIGTVAGFIGAVDAWGWSYLQAGALFFGPAIFIFILAMISKSLDN
jgi:hypothetical protein